MENQFYQNGTDIIIIISCMAGFIIMCTRILYKSKCKNINFCCGMIVVDRNVEIETELTDVIPRQTENV